MWKRLNALADIAKSVIIKQRGYIAAPWDVVVINSIEFNRGPGAQIGHDDNHYHNTYLPKVILTN